MRLQEGGVANFTVVRAGRADFVATVMYRVEYNDASPDDLFLLSNDTVLVYAVGEWTKNISVAVKDDDIPETDELFYIVLYNATGTYVLVFLKSDENKNVAICITMIYVFMAGNICLYSISL